MYKTGICGIDRLLSKHNSGVVQLVSDDDIIAESIVLNMIKTRVSVYYDIRNNANMPRARAIASHGNVHWVKCDGVNGNIFEGIKKSFVTGAFDVAVIDDIPSIYSKEARDDYEIVEMIAEMLMDLKSYCISTDKNIFLLNRLQEDDGVPCYGRGTIANVVSYTMLLKKWATIIRNRTPIGQEILISGSSDRKPICDVIGVFDDYTIPHAYWLYLRGMREHIITTTQNAYWFGDKTYKTKWMLIKALEGSLGVEVEKLINKGDCDGQ